MIFLLLVIVDVSSLLLYVQFIRRLLIMAWFLKLHLTIHLFILPLSLNKSISKVEVFGGR